MKNETLILWDLDNTLYEETPAITEMFNRAVRQTLRDVTELDLTDVEADELLAESRKTYGDYMTTMVRRGYALERLHEVIHDRMEARLLEPDQDTISAIEKSSRQGIRHAILSHGHMSWALKVLDKIGLRPFFNEASIVSLEKVGFIKKNVGTGAFDHALALLKANAQNTIMVEDVAKNLIYPHAMGMKTILIHYGRLKETDEKPPYVWRCCATPAEAVEAVLSLSRGAAPAIDPAPIP